MAAIASGPATVAEDAANVAERDLCVDHGERPARPGESHHARGLQAAVVELQEAPILLTAVNAHRTGAHAVDVGQVACDDGIRGAPRGASGGGSRAVTANAHHLAFLDLPIEYFHPDAVMSKRAERLGLAPEMVELQHDGVGFAAIDAGMVCQIGEQVRLGPLPTGAKRGAGGLLHAGLAPPLTGVEVLFLDVALAATAPLQEHMFA